MNGRKRGLVLEDAFKMVNWMVELGLLKSLQGHPRQPAKRPRDGVPKNQPPKVPPTGTVKVRRISFTIKNPCTMLHDQWWFKDYNKYK